MPRLRVSSEIEAPVENVFNLFTDIEHATEHVAANQLPPPEGAV